MKRIKDKKSVFFLVFKKDETVDGLFGLDRKDF